MAEHKFKIGQPVYFDPTKPLFAPRIDDRYHVICRISEHQYRIKSECTGQEWAAGERELRPSRPLRHK